MATIFATAPGKTILFGEHAVVYGYPAIAVPVNEIQAKVKIFPVIGSSPDEIHFVAPQIQFEKQYKDMDFNHPLKIALDEVKKYLSISVYPACKIHISSSIPISSGLGSSAAISVALIKAMLEYVGFQASPSQISELAFKVEVEFHGNPSGIDNSVIAHQKPIYFQKNKEIDFIHPVGIFTIIIADSGVKGNTKTAVSQVRERWLNDPQLYETYFNEIGEIVQNARKAIETSDHFVLGDLMNRNQFLLKEIGVSHPALETLISVANNNGALGSKLCGAGMGGNIIALVEEEKSTNIAKALQDHGAVHTIIMNLKREEKDG